MYILHIREKIESSGLTYDEIAQKMGVTRSTLLSYATNNNPHIATLDKLAIILNCHIGELVEFHPIDKKVKRISKSIRKDMRKEMRQYDKFRQYEREAAQMEEEALKALHSEGAVLTFEESKSEPLQQEEIEVARNKVDIVKEIIPQNSVSEDVSFTTSVTEDLHKMEILTDIMKKLNKPTPANIVAKHISRSAWGEKIKVEVVEYYLQLMPEVKHIPSAGYVLLNK